VSVSKTLNPFEAKMLEKKKKDDEEKARKA